MGYIDGPNGLEPGSSVHLTRSYPEHKEQVSVGRWKSTAVDAVGKDPGELTVEYLDTVCSIGHIGQALLSGLLAATSTQPDRTAGKITRFVATTRRQETAAILRQRHIEDNDRIIIYTSENNLPAIRESGTVILACRPGDLDGILNTVGIRFELSKKPAISVLQTRTAQEIVDALNDMVQINGHAASLVPTVVRAAPNRAAGWKCSTTIIENCEPLPEDRLVMVTWIFERVGQVKFLFGDAFCAGVMLAGGGPAVISVALSGMFDGCVEGGLTQEETIAIGHQMLLGLVAPLNRPHLLQMRESAASCPKAPTIKP
ncbi:hypothetical protein BJX65DRAFT_312605 [Aspergillus insuetus]